MEGIKQELKRVRDLKRNAESTIELLRSDMEQGKIHLRVNESQSFRQKLAEAIVKEAHPGYHSQGYYYADPVEGRVYYREQNAPWNPWSEAVDWRIVPVSELVPSNHDFNPQVEDWGEELKNSEVALADIIKAWIESEDEELEEDGSIPEWAWKQVSEVIDWARGQDDFESIISEAEEEAENRAYDFALEGIFDEVVVEINQ